MNAYQHSKFRMYHAVYNFLIEHKAVWSGINGYTTIVKDFSQLIDNISSLTGKKIRSIAGVTLSTANLKKELCHSALVVSGTLVAIADQEKKFEMLKSMDFTRSQLEDLPAEMLPGICRLIHTTATANKEPLTAFNITDDTLQEFEQLITQYEHLCTAPRMAINVRKTLGETLKELFAETDQLLKKRLDKVSVFFKKENSAYYNEYKNNRIIVNQGSRSTKVSGKITNSTTGEPLKNVSVTAEGTGLLAHSDADGNYTLKIPKTGPVKMVFEQDGFHPKTIDDVELKLGRNTVVPVEMVTS
ncbi:MAG: carboxypeptidase regulatory-like domain-containing protein [Chitinophagaceae bacterium]|nr:carboxypeptidase regulatory-like domain-containing protein [Chitinophagaceae bacterium]